MGVISTNRTALPTCGDDYFPIDYLIESPITTEDEEEEDHGSQAIQRQPDCTSISRKRRRVDQHRHPYFHQNIVGASAGKKNAGVRKQRRLENCAGLMAILWSPLYRSNHRDRNLDTYTTHNVSKSRSLWFGPYKGDQNSGDTLLEYGSSRLLVALVDNEDICQDLSDTLPETISAFTQLFLEAEKMKAWNSFIHKTEEEQNAFLRRQRRGRKTSSAFGKMVDKKQEPNSGKLNGAASSVIKEEKRHIHPAYSGSLCFRRIENRLKTLLTQKHVPWEKLEQFERDLTDFFTTSPDGVFITVLESGYDRLLLHAVAQYMRLKSQSIGPLDHRETQIETYSDRIFEPPMQTLADFLRQHYGKPSVPGNGHCQDGLVVKAKGEKLS